MKTFRVALRGENFLLRSEGVVRRLGFHVTRFVDAPDEHEAEYCAVDALRRERSLREAVSNGPEDPPMLFAEKIEEIQPADVPENRTPGLNFFEDAR